MQISSSSCGFNPDGFLDAQKPAPLLRTGLPMDSTRESTNKIFSQYGTVKDTNVLPVREGKNAAAAFVTMNTVDDAKWIVDNVNGNVPQGLTNNVTVVFSTPRDQRKGGGKGMKGMDAMWTMMSMMMGMGGGGWGGGGWGKGGWGKGGWGKGGGGYNPAKHKTVMCHFWEQQGACHRGDSCTFAHGAHEIKGGGKGANGSVGQMALGGKGKGW